MGCDFDRLTATARVAPTAPPQVDGLGCHPAEGDSQGGGAYADPIRTAIEACAALLSPFAISWVEPESRDAVRVSFRDETGYHTAIVDFAGDDPDIYGVHVGLHGIESSYNLELTGDRWHDVLDAAEVVRDGGKWGGTPEMGAALDAGNADAVVATLAGEVRP